MADRQIVALLRFSHWDGDSKTLQLINPILPTDFIKSVYQAWVLMCSTARFRRASAYDDGESIWYPINVKMEKYLEIAGIETYPEQVENGADGNKVRGEIEYYVHNFHPINEHKRDDVAWLIEISLIPDDDVRFLIKSHILLKSKDLYPVAMQGHTLAALKSLDDAMTYYIDALRDRIEYKPSDDEEIQSGQKLT